MDISITSPNENLVLETSENYTMTVTASTATLTVSAQRNGLKWYVMVRKYGMASHGMTLTRFYWISKPDHHSQADTVFGAMRGLETFSQLISPYNYTLPCVTITDYPRYESLVS